jgi:uncharacterized protein (DUF1697 family)
MTKYVALLRAVNVGGNGKLPMSELKAMCVDAGFAKVQTYIASGNVLFESQASPNEVKSDLAARLHAFARTPVGVVLRTATEMAEVLKENPFPDAPRDKTVAIFLDEPPPADALNQAPRVKDEEMRLGTREIYVHYGAGIGTSKLQIPAAQAGTARNLNTVAKLVEIASKL